MNRIDAVFQKKQKEILTLYATAGYPSLNDTLPVLQHLQAAGADMVEIGVPFSDPLADGPTIQKSSDTALANGMSVATLFEQLTDMRKSIHIPVLLMGYLNPVMSYGVEEFCKKCAEVGIDGLILPDLPFDLYEEQYRKVFEKYNLANVMLITPQTTNERILQIDQSASGFIYMVSTASTTGARTGISEDQVAYFERIEAMQLKTPRLIGFGISDAATYRTACQYSNGAIIGSAFIKALTADNLEESVKDYIKKVR